MEAQKINRIGELYETLDQCWDELKGIEGELQANLECPHCHTLGTVNITFGKKWNYISCLECDLRTSEFDNANDAIEQWKAICRAVEETERMRANNENQNPES